MASQIHDVVKMLSGSFRKTFDDYKGLYLFGTYLTEPVAEDEDIEIVALFENTDKQKREAIWPIVGKVETELNVSIDLYPYTQEEFKNDEYLYDEVMKSGKFYDKLGINK